MKKYLNASLSLILSLVLVLSVFLVPSFAVNESSSHEETATQEEEPSSIKVKSYKDYDLTGDGRFSISDVRIILRISAKLDVLPEGIDISVFDMDKNGRLTITDARLLLIDLLGIDTSKTVTGTKPHTTKPPATQKPVTTTRDRMKPVDSGKVLGSEGYAFRESVVYDLTNDQMLYSYNATTAAYPASMTKLMTALVASKYVPMDYVITVGSEIYLTESNS